MKNNIYSILLIICSIVCIQEMEAQIYQFPNSRYGLGELRENTSIRQQSMGYTQVAIMDSNYNGLSLNNPATNAKNKAFGFESGISGIFYNVSTNRESFKNKDYYLQAVSISIPLWKKKEWGLNFGIAPFSKVGYSLKSGTAKDTQYWKGTGGFNNYSVGIGLKLFKGFYVGGSIAYLYGKDELEQAIYFTDDTTAGLIKKQVSSGGGINFNTGFIYQQNLDSGGDYQFSIGGAFRPQTNMQSAYDVFTYTFFPSEGTEIGDTVQLSLNKQGSLILPMNYSMGASILLNRKLLIGGEYSFTQWSKFILNNKQDNLKDANSIHFGLQYTPSGKLDDYGWVKLPYHKRMIYRAGFKYATSYLNTQPNSFAITGGFGFPLNRIGTNIDLGIEYGKFGTPQNAEVRTEYLKISLGFRLIDMRWFRRYKEE